MCKTQCKTFWWSLDYISVFGISDQLYKRAVIISRAFKFGKSLKGSVVWPHSVCKLRFVLAPAEIQVHISLKQTNKEMSWEKSGNPSRAPQVGDGAGVLWVEDSGPAKSILWGLHWERNAFWTLKKIKMKAINHSKLRLPANNELELNHRPFRWAHLWKGKDKIQGKFSSLEAFENRLPKGQFVVVECGRWGQRQGNAFYTIKILKDPLSLKLYIF